MYDYPIHDRRRWKFGSPKQLKEILLRWYPLNKEFIDWLAEQGFKIVYQTDWKQGTGSVWWGLRQINVSSQGTTHLADKTLIHEVIHISVPGNNMPGGAYWDYEEAIDEIAEVYLNDLEFTRYLKERLPISEEKPAK